MKFKFFERKIFLLALLFIFLNPLYVAIIIYPKGISTPKINYCV